MQSRERPVLEKVTKFRHLDFNFFDVRCQLFLYQKTASRHEFTGYLFHDVHEKQQQMQ